jgi:hypothetical protein
MGRAFLVTGNPGSGKSALADELGRRELLDLFDRVFLLQIDTPTQEARLAAHDAAHPPGRREAGRQEIRDGRPVFEMQMLKLGAVALDGTASTALIADQLLAFVTVT